MKLQTFSRKIVTLRKARRLSMPDLALKACVPKSLLWHVETSPKANPTIHTLQKISRALGVDVIELVQ